MLWWGRIGRIAEFLGALVIVAEIIGPARIRSFGSMLRERSVKAIADTNIQDPIAWLKAMVEYYSAPFGSEEERVALKKTETYQTDSLFYLVVLASLAGGGYIAHELWQSVWLTAAGVLMGLGVASLIGPLVTCGLGLILRARGLAFDTVIAAPIAWVLDRDAVEKWIKTAAAVMLVLGFHFDLLAP